MRNIFIIFFCMLLTITAIATPRKQYVIAVQNAEGWHYTAFDLTFQLKKDGKEFDKAEADKIKVKVDASTGNQKAAEWQKEINIYQGLTNTFICVPQFENLKSPVTNTLEVITPNKDAQTPEAQLIFWGILKTNAVEQVTP